MFITLDPAHEAMKLGYEERLATALARAHTRQAAADATATTATHFTPRTPAGIRRRRAIRHRSPHWRTAHPTTQGGAS